MHPNISFFDTIIRLFVGIIIGASFGAMNNAIGVLAIYPIVTALVAWDPMYYKLRWYTTEMSPYPNKATKVAKTTRTRCVSVRKPVRAGA
ncbi:MAG: DUF2892 domain-containing protein [Bacteroidota bacterium]